MKTSKTILTICALVLLACFSAKANPFPTNSVTGSVGLMFTYPTNGITDELVFRIYGNTNLNQPNNWYVITNAVATNFFPYQGAFDVGSNWVATNMVFKVTVVPGAYFFAGTGSNMWGESVFSNFAQTSPAPQGMALRIIKLP